jgi:hypothetical protein
VSQLRSRAAWLVPGMIRHGLPGLDPAMPAEEYIARALGAICGAASDGLRRGGGLALDYKELPGASWGAMAAHFGIAPDAAEAARMVETAQFNAKNPGMFFERDTESKQMKATAEIRRLVAGHVAPACAWLS